MPEPIVQKMMRRDRAAAAMGIRLEESGPGRAVLSMVVRDDMTNGFGIIHGGFVFALADTAFAYACNEGDRITVSAGADITFLAPTHAGQRLTATAQLRARNGRSGVCDVTVVDEAGAVVAEFRGRSFTTDRTLS